MPKVGRPKSDNTKGDKFSFRLDAKTVSSLDEYCKKHGISRSEAMRLALNALIDGKVVTLEESKRENKAMPAFLL